MLRRKYLSQFRTDNLTERGERRVGLYLSEFSLIRAANSGNRITERQENERGGSVATEDAKVIADRTRSEDTNAKEESIEKKLAIAGVRTVDPSIVHRPGSSRGQAAKTTEDKATQMRQNLSSVKLQENDDLDDDSSVAEDTSGPPRYILVGWDSFRSKTMVLLLVLLVLWAAVYFPLIGT